jgi:hypothetical protein
MSIVVLIFACFFIIVAVVLTSITILINQRRRKCLNYKSPWCYTDWQCGSNKTNSDPTKGPLSVGLPDASISYPITQNSAKDNGFFAYPQMLAGIKQCEVTDYYVLADSRIGTWDETKGYITFPDGSTANNVNPSQNRTTTINGTSVTAPDINYTIPVSNGTIMGQAVYYFTVASTTGNGGDVFMVVRDLVESPDYGNGLQAKTTGNLVTYGPSNSNNSETYPGYMEPLTISSGTTSKSTGRTPSFKYTHPITSVASANGGGTVSTAVPLGINTLVNLPDFKYVTAQIPNQVMDMTVDPSKATYTPTTGTTSTTTVGPATITKINSACTTGGSGGCFFNYPANLGKSNNPAITSNWNQAIDPEELLPKYTYTRGPSNNITTVSTTSTTKDPRHLSYTWAIDEVQKTPTDIALSLPPPGPTPTPTDNIPDPRWYFNRKGIALFLTATTSSTNQTIYRPVIETTRYTDSTEGNACFQFAPDWQMPPIA